GFESGVDKFYFSGNGGFNSTWTFASVSSYNGSVGTDAGAQFIYDTTDHKLYYDADGSGTSSSGVLIATLDADSDAISAVDSSTAGGDIAVYV
ncbi:FecR domain-containing protein, partial [Aduncisulcus paluster]